jgi:protein gp37
MSQNTPIEWTDTTWNPVRGCTKVSPGCAHCYAETFAERWRGVKGHAYEQGFDLRLVPEKLTDPLHWREAAARVRQQHERTCFRRACRTISSTACSR